MHTLCQVGKIKNTIISRSEKFPIYSTSYVYVFLFGTKNNYFEVKKNGNIFAQNIMTYFTTKYVNYGIKYVDFVAIPSI